MKILIGYESSGVVREAFPYHMKLKPGTLTGEARREAMRDHNQPRMNKC